MEVFNKFNNFFKKSIRRSEDYQEQEIRILQQLLRIQLKSLQIVIYLHARYYVMEVELVSFSNLLYKFNLKNIIQTAVRPFLTVL